MQASTYGTRLPGLPREPLTGRLIVVEGPDGSGRTTEVSLLRDWLEIQGHPVVESGLRRSTLVAEQIDRAKQGHTLGGTTLALFYAVDFADQLENKIIPALAAGSTVLADRYIYTLMARAIVRGASRAWAQRLYAFAVRPDLVIHLDAKPDILLHRSIGKYGSLDYWESGMDLCLSRDRFESFFLYQDRLRAEFEWMTPEYGFHRVDANRTPTQVHADVRAIVRDCYRGTLVDAPVPEAAPALLRARARKAAAG
ncbi:MAG TPA: thymidylate kinase [Thermoplasmata archaeon]|nr:thymidylate kinase [Thermoplasmata archaeon]